MIKYTLSYPTVLVWLLCLLYACNSDSNKEYLQNNQPEAFKEDLWSSLSNYREKIKQSTETDSSLYWRAAMGNIFAQAEEWDSVFSVARDIYITGYQTRNFDVPYLQLSNLSDAVDSKNDTLWARITEIKGAINYFRGDYEQALSQYEQCVKFWEKYPVSSRLLGCYNMLVIMYTINGDYPLVESVAKSAIPVCIDLKDTILLQSFHLNLGKAQVSQNKWQKALDNFREAHHLMPYEDGLYECNSAAALINGKQARKALPLAQKALEKRKTYQGNAILDIATAYNVLASAHLELNHLSQATQNFQLSLEEALNYYPPHHREIGKAYIALGDSYNKQKLWNLALKQYQEALEVFLPNFQASSIDDCPTRDSLFTKEIWLLEALQKKGVIYRDKYRQEGDLKDLEIAATHFITAINFINQIKLHYTETGAKAFLGDYSLPYLEDALQTQLLLHDITKNSKHQEVAFELAQQATAFLLRESVNDQRAMEVAQVPLDTINLLHELNADIVKMQSAITEAEFITTSDSLRQLLFQLKRTRLSLLEKMERDYPKYYQIKHSLKPIPLSQLQNGLDSNTLVIKYFLGKEQLYLFAFSRQSFHTFRTIIDTTFYQKIQNFRKTLSDLDYLREKPQKAEKLFLSSSHYLYQQLLEPALETLQKENLNQLILIPDGMLNYLSFECLLMEPTDSWLNSKLYLLNHYAINYAYFSGLLLNEKFPQVNRRSRFLGFGTEYNDNTLKQINAIQQDTLANQQIKEALRDKNLGKLAYADDEVQEIAYLLNGKAFLNKKATKRTFLKKIPGFEVIHIATHGFIDTENDSTAFIVFNKDENSEDFLLSLPEIYGLRLDADLVALSACQTGTGALQRSEGVMSLARAFQFAGSSSLIASQWSLSDRTSSIIMKEFYKKLDEGLPKSKALRQAKLEYLRNDQLSSPAYRIPAYWGAIILIGDDAPLEFEAVGFRWWWILMIGGLLLGIMGWGSYRRQKRR